jgi:nucleoside-diphosphate-sugar epimerase
VQLEQARAHRIQSPAMSVRYRDGVRVVIAGGHGQIAMRLAKLLTDRGDRPVGIVRNPDQLEDLRALGADAVVCDLESAPVDEVASHLDGADAVVFAAGAGPGSGMARKETVDRGAAVLCADAAERAGVRRYLMISAMGADREPPPDADPVFAAYLRAKGAADAYLTSCAGLDWTILRPGRLTNETGTGLVRLAVHTGRGTVPRDDVAAVLLALLDIPVVGVTLELVTGDTPVYEAVRACDH